MEKKFKTPLSIKGTKEECDALVSGLETLGYRAGNGDSMAYSKTWCVLVTCFAGDNDAFGYYRHEVGERVNVSASNRDLVMALAAMVDSDEFYPGEMVVATNTSEEKQYTEGSMYIVDQAWAHSIRAYDNNKIHNGWGNQNFRKATVDEIQEYFKDHRNSSWTPEECKKMMVAVEAEPIAYELIQEYPGSPKKGCTVSSSTTKYKDFLVKDLRSGKQWFWGNVDIKDHPSFWKPIYKPTSIKVPYEGGELWLSIKKGRAVFKDRSFTKYELEQIIGEYFSLENNRYQPTTFTFGCSGQYKGITAESIQKVIDLL